MPSDQELLRRILDRDSGAFDVLFARHEGAVRRRLAGIVRDSVAADDLLQEAFLRLWTRAAQFGGKGTVRAWLLKIATNLALNHLRRRRRHPRRPLLPQRSAAGDTDEPVLSDWMIDPSASAPDAEAERAERREILRQLVGALPGGKRRVLRMVHERQMELHEIAEELGIPLGTVKSRLHYGMRRLAEAARELGLDWENI